MACVRVVVSALGLELFQPFLDAEGTGCTAFGAE